MCMYALAVGQVAQRVCIAAMTGSNSVAFEFGPLTGPKRSVCSLSCRPTIWHSAAASALGKISQKTNDLAREAVGSSGVLGRAIAIRMLSRYSFLYHADHLVCTTTVTDAHAQFLHHLERGSYCAKSV